MYTFRAQGQIYHSINSLYPTDQHPAHLLLYFYDTANEVDRILYQNSHLHPGVIRDVIQLITENPYSQFFRSLNEIPHLKDCQIKLKADPTMKDRNAAPPTVSQVAAIWIEDDNATELRERDIIVQQKNGKSDRIRYNYGCYDPLQYLLLFPLGEPGWHRGIKRQKRNRAGIFFKPEPCTAANASTAEELINNEEAVYEENSKKSKMVSAREYYAYRLQIRPTINSILLQSGRLLQQYVVDMYVKIETARLDFFRYRQKEIRADLYQGIVDSNKQGESEGSKVGKRIILPGSFIGGPRDMRKRYLDAMSSVEKYGKPDLFLTMTCNPNRNEIQEQLNDNELAQNRHDLLTRIFRSKFQELRNEVIKKKLFGPAAAYTYVIEFQKRGLPHVHMLLILEKGYKLNTPHKFDAIISAELPDNLKNPHLFSMVVKHMIHGPCGKLNKSNVCMLNGTCKDHYPRIHSEHTTDGYPLYKRQAAKDEVMVRGHKVDNQWVPYNPYLLAMFDCHINVEVCSTIKAVKYLYKYMYKGHDQIIYNIIKCNDNEDIDEIKQYQSARWESPPEAVWRIYQFPLHEMIPAVISLQLHLDGCQLVNFQKDTNLNSITHSDYHSRTMLTQFFWMNKYNTKAKARKLLYKDFPSLYVWKVQKRIWTERKSRNVLGRIITANPNEGDRYFLRLLLTNAAGPESYEDLRTVNKIEYATNRETAVSLGLLQDDKSHEKYMQEAATFLMPASLRHLFSTILTSCNPTNPKKLFFKFEEDMIEDYIHFQKLTKEEARQTLLTDISLELQSLGRDIQHYQLDNLVTSVAPLNPIFREIKDELDIHVSEQDLSSVLNLNAEQVLAYNKILEAVYEKKQVSFFIDGPGGTGKTFIYKALLATIRAQGMIALATASSGVAASILPKRKNSSFSI